MMAITAIIPANHLQWSTMTDGPELQTSYLIMIKSLNNF